MSSDLKRRIGRMIDDELAARLAELEQAREDAAEEIAAIRAEFEERAKHRNLESVA